MFFSTSSVHTSLVIDFGSTSVGVALVVKKVSKNNQLSKSEIIFAHREWVLSIDKPNSSQFLSSMTLLLDRALQIVQEKGISILKKSFHKSSIDTIHCVYASPWYVSQTHVVDLINNKEIQFTPQVLDTLIAREEMKLHDANQGLRIIDKKITHIKLNGYETASPHTKFAKHISATMYMCLVQTDIIKRIEASVRKRVNSHAITHHSFSLAVYSAVRNYYSQDNFIILDIGGEVSDINIIQEGSLRHEVSFPFGKNAVLRKMSEKSDENPNIALSKIKIAYENNAHPDHASDMITKLEIIKKKWMTAFQEALSHIQNNFTPRHIFITCDTDVTAFFTEIITKDEFSTIMKVSSPFILRSITSDLFKDRIEWKNMREDVFLSIDVYFLDSIST